MENNKKENIYSEPLYTQEQVENAHDYAMAEIKEKIFSKYPPYDTHIRKHGEMLIIAYRKVHEKALFGKAGNSNGYGNH